MMALKATRATRTTVLFSEIGLLKSNITWNKQRLEELCLLALEKSFDDLISLKENRRDYKNAYKKAFDNYQKALKEAQYYSSKTRC